MKIAIFKFSLLFVLLLSFIACKKQDKNEGKDELVSADGIVTDTGDPAADGCGWAIRIAETNYKPVYLATSFQVEGKQVKVTYVLQDTYFACGLSRGLRYISIKTIE